MRSTTSTSGRFARREKSAGAVLSSTRLNGARAPSRMHVSKSNWRVAWVPAWSRLRASLASGAGMTQVGESGRALGGSLCAGYAGLRDRAADKRQAMTFSIIARDEETGRIGVAVASKFFAVGARSIAVKTGRRRRQPGPLQSLLWAPRAGADGRRGLGGRSGTAADHGRRRPPNAAGAHDGPARPIRRSHRQRLHRLVRAHLQGPTFSVAGNTLAGAGVLEAMAASYEANSEMPFARRLIAAMQAGEAAGGDTRGRQSAALVVHDAEDYSLLDLRADDHADPLAEIARLEEVARQSWVHFRRVLPSADKTARRTGRRGNPRQDRRLDRGRLRIAATGSSRRPCAAYARRRNANIAP